MCGILCTKIVDPRMLALAFCGGVVIHRSSSSRYVAGSDGRRLGVSTASARSQRCRRGARVRVVQMSSEDHLEYGAKFTMTDRRPIPLTAAQFWSGFDNYLALQEKLGFHEDTRLEPGPENMVGATISFEYLGGRTYETLRIKDDEKMVWMMDIPEPNVIFSFYEAMISVFPEAEGKQAEAALKIDAVFLSKEREERERIYNASIPVMNSRLREVTDFVLERDGTRASLKGTLEVPPEEMWKRIRNWNDISWVMNAESVEVVKQDEEQIRRKEPLGRTITFKDGGFVYEIIRELDDEKRKLVYVVENATALPVQTYKATLVCNPHPDGPGKTSLSYDAVFIAKDGVDPLAVKAGLETNLPNNFAWISETLGKEAASSPPSSPSPVATPKPETPKPASRKGRPFFVRPFWCR